MNEIEKLREALEQCQRALEVMVAPEAIRSTSVQSAWALAVAAEAKARAVLKSA